VEQTKVGVFYVWVQFDSDPSSFYFETEWWMPVHALYEGVEGYAGGSGVALLAKCRARLPTNYRRALGVR
jgi:hypothetical protein